MEATKQSSVYFWGMFLGKDNPIPTKIKELQGKGVTQVASGGFFYVAVTASGQVYGWGTSKHHRFGLAQEEDIPVPRLVPLKVKAVKISAGNWHSLLIDSQQTVWSTGHNKQGACGSGNFQTVAAFSPIESKLKFKQISCGDCFSLLLDLQGNLHSCGHADMHGHKTKQHLNKIKKIQFKTPIKTMYAGFTNSLAVTQQGQTYSWGQGLCFQLGHGNKNSQKQPKLIKGLQGVKINQVSASRGEKNAHSMAVDQAGNVYTWGAGYKGKLGHQATWSHDDAADQPVPRKLQAVKGIIKTSAGGIHSNILNENGQILSFGCGSNGRLGHIESKQHVYLYRQGFPRVIQSLKGVKVLNIQSSYYHNICVGQPL